MIVVDTSVLIAVARGEPAVERLLRVFESGEPMVMSAASYVETGMVLARRFGPPALGHLGRLREAVPLHLRDVDAEQADAALDAFTRYGKGMGHPAQLDFGDCFAYALAKTADAPLLYVGEDFARTDIRSAL